MLDQSNVTKALSHVCKAFLLKSPPPSWKPPTLRRTCFPSGWCALDAYYLQFFRRDWHRAVVITCIFAPKQPYTPYTPYIPTGLHMSMAPGMPGGSWNCCPPLGEWDGSSGLERGETLTVSDASLCQRGKARDGRAVVRQMAGGRSERERGAADDIRREGHSVRRCGSAHWRNE